MPLNHLNIRYLSKYDAEFFDLNSSTDELPFGLPSESEVESEEEDFELEGNESSETTKERNSSQRRRLLISPSNRCGRLSLLSISISVYLFWVFVTAYVFREHNTKNIRNEFKKRT